MNKEKLKLYNKEKLIDIIEKLSIEFAVKNQQYEYIRHNDYSKELQARIDKTINFINDNAIYKKITVNQQVYYNEYIINQALDILRGEDK